MLGAAWGLPLCVCSLGAGQVEALAECVRTFDGGVIVVSHDQVARRALAACGDGGARLCGEAGWVLWCRSVEDGVGIRPNVFAPRCVAAAPDALRGGGSWAQYFVSRVANEVWVVADGAVTRIESFEAYTKKIHSRLK